MLVAPRELITNDLKQHFELTPINASAFCNRRSMKLIMSTVTLHHIFVYAHFVISEIKRM